MKDFIKNNIRFVTFLAVTAVIAIVLIVLDFTQYMKVDDFIRKIDKKGDEISKVNQTGKSAPAEKEIVPLMIQVPETLKDGEVEKIEMPAVDAQKKFDEWNKARKNTRIVKDNVGLIEEDAAALRLKVEDIQRIFGHIFDPAFESFLKILKAPADLKDASLSAEEIQGLKDAYAKAVAGVSRKSFAEIFAKLFQDKKVMDMLEEPSDNNRKFTAEKQKELFNDLRSEYLKTLAVELKSSASDAQKACFAKIAATQFDAAFVDFTKTAEVLTYANRIDADLKAKYPDFGIVAFFQALGLQATLPNNQFLEFIQRLAMVIEKDVPIAADASLLRNEQQVALAKREAVCKLFWNEDQIPPPGNVAHLVTRLQVYEYLFKTLKASGKTQLYSLRQTGDISGKALKGQPYRVYSFNITVTGTMNDVRGFINALHDGYLTHHTFAMSDLSILLKDGVDRSYVTSILDMPEAYELGLLKGLVQKYNDLKRVTDSGVKAGKGSADKKSATASIAVNKVDSKQMGNAVLNEKNYGAVAVGNLNVVSATFNFDYIIYTGDSLLFKGK